MQVCMYTHEHYTQKERGKGKNDLLLLLLLGERDQVTKFLLIAFRQSLSNSNCHFSCFSLSSTRIAGKCQQALQEWFHLFLTTSLALRKFLQTHSSLTILGFGLICFIPHCQEELCSDWSNLISHQGGNDRWLVINANKTHYLPDPSNWRLGSAFKNGL